MAKPWAGITAGLLAGAAGATAKNAISHLDTAVTGSAPATSPGSNTVSGAASHAVGGSDRADALGPLGGLAIGVGVGALAGLVRGANATPPPVVAAIATGLAAMGIGTGLAAVTKDKSATEPTNLARDLIAHLGYGAVTSYALHRMLDSRTPSVSRFRP